MCPPSCIFEPRHVTPMRARAAHCACTAYVLIWTGAGVEHGQVAPRSLIALLTPIHTRRFFTVSLQSASKVYESQDVWIMSNHPASPCPPLIVPIRTVRTHTHAHTQTYCTYARTYVGTYVRTHVRAQTHAHTHTVTHTHTHAHTDMHAHAPTHVGVYVVRTYVRAQTYAYTHTQSHTHTHTPTYMPTHPPTPPPTHTPPHSARFRAFRTHDFERSRLLCLLEPLVLPGCVELDGLLLN